METLEERLQRELHRLSPPADPSGVVDQILRRAARRHARRSAGIVLLTLSVVAGSLGGFYALSRVFRGAGEPASNTAVVTNGSITLSLNSEPAMPATQRIALLDPAGTRLRFLKTGDRVATEPSWSPDGARVVYWRAGHQGTQGLWIMNADGSDPRPLYETTASIWGIEWSPDGSRIAFIDVVVPEGPATELDFSDDLFVMNADGTNVTPLITDGQVTDFDWSPDGTRLVIERLFAIGDDRLGTDLAVVDGDGSREIPVTTDGVSGDPTWSPDGSSIVFVGSDTGDVRDRDLFAVSPDGTGRVQLTDDEATEEDPVFSPDGSLVAYTRFPQGDGSACELVLMEPDGTDARVIATKQSLGGCPVALAWQPLPAGQQDPTPTGVPTPTQYSGVTPLPTEAPSPDLSWQDVSSTLSGVGAVCGVTSVEGDFTGTGVVGTAYVFEPEPEGGCAGPNENFQHVGVAGPDGDVVAISDELATCLDLFGCTAYGAPDVDGDGSAEIAISIGMADGVAGTLLDVSSSTDRIEVELMEVAPPADVERGFPPGPFLFLIGGGGLSTTGGSYCLDAEPDVRLFVIWWADLRDADTQAWDVRAAAFQTQGDELRLDWTSTYRVPEDEPDLPPRAGDDLCGSPVR